MGGFYEHLADAIVINKARREHYSARTGGRTRRLSSYLIWFERATLPIAWNLDRRARPFIERGIPIVEADFVSMQKILPPETPPRRGGVAPAEALGEVAAGLARLRALSKEAIPRDGYAEIAHASRALLDDLARIEARTDADFCMTRHFVESLGLASANAVGYSARSGGAVNALARSFLRTQVLGLRFVLFFDRRTQPFLKEGVAIIKNDIPEIPFAEAYARMLEPAAAAPAAAGA